MKMRVIVSILFLIGCVVLPNGFAQAENENDVRVLIVHKDEGDVSTQSSTTSEDKYEVVSVPKEDVSDTLSKLNGDRDIESAEVDQLVYTQALPPNDTYFEKQSRDFEVMKVVEAWEQYEPEEEVTVAIVDSGIDLKHPELRSRLIEGKNFIHEDEPPMDSTGHGTHVAGLVGAVTNNKMGIASAAKNVKLMPVKVFEGKTTYMSTVIQGIRYSVDHGADIINLSLGSYNNMDALEDAIDYAVDKGVLVVGAAGNDNDHAVLYPATYADVLAVGSIDSAKGTKSAFSNYGETIDVSAPGTNIFSTWMSGYETLDGTSMSTAIVSSVSSMVKQQYPFLTGLQVKDVMENSATPLPQIELLGKGLINAEEALNYVKTKNRIYGQTSVETAVNISQNGWPSLKEKELKMDGETLNGSFVILASGNSFPDSLAASPLGAYLDSPILLTKNGKLSESVKEELKRLNPTHVLMMGGQNAISSGVENEVKNLEIDTRRIYGLDRYETAVAINELIPYTSNKAFVVSGQNYPDALSIASYSGRLQYPVLFVQKENIPLTVRSYMEENDISKTYVIGGQGIISSKVEDNLPGHFRIYGLDRYETNMKVHQTFASKGAESLYFATGKKFPDALSISPLASRTDSPIVLVDNKENPELQKSINVFTNRKSYHILGGPGAIPVQKAWQIDQYMKSK
ncbi:S8 family serine peptidase [Rossellomorea vietnamensis]|uniref:S8 family serine peptidase n=1 Tax=Rossellomorea vietnamensis TaxID=218284 RepID=A0ACD4C408_9BACI|nr:cell wall-binding repeat-containing protein [Rossellomorea vietnamensis]UXH43238.1 S8 family serine peptidase [Rossellomorea vietnamensis]